MAGIIIDGVVGVEFVAPMQIISNDPAFVTDSLSLRQQVARRKAQRWEITTNLMPSNDSADFFVHNVTNGFSDVFKIQMPQVYRPVKASSATTFEVAVAANKGARTIQVKCVGKIAKGEFIQFAGSTKVYLVTKGVTGNGTIDIYPELINNQLLGAKILYDTNVQMSCRYDPSVALGIKYVDGILSDPGSVKLVEAL